MANFLKKFFTREDGELSQILIGCGIFTIVALIVDFTYGHIGGLLHSWYAVPFYLLHIFLALSWVIVIAGRNNPNLEYWRVIRKYSTR